MAIERNEQTVLQLLTIAHLKMLIASTNGITPITLNEAFNEAVGNNINYSVSYDEFLEKGRSGVCEDN